MAKSNRICTIPGCGKKRFGHGWCAAHYQRWRRNGDPLGGGTASGALIEFVHNVALKHEGDECLIWPYGKYKNGYGQLRVNGRHYGAHRYVCELAKGEPPTPRHEAAHTCGKGSMGCVSPHHLEWKTHVENEADKQAHGTTNRGERNGAAKLTEDQAQVVISLKGKLTQAKISALFGVSRSHISSVHSGKTWAHLPR